MIIQDNFDKKNALPTNNDYQKVGKGLNDIDKQNENDKKINPLFQIEEENEELDDKWDFFK